ncbi:DegT/DnrJ/EryC1/StrS family aminotransferase [Rhodopirellula halodulae]|uniref:DegT/DnrJ/EryC1/StrS family aminotransferase n=1 Tax=Rhodopirellula halodulae TaxID=2894198 RepID=UPI0028F40EB3|nr:DegT/DnrJ/EryC1/StrS family aminotransferase [Rhodopirellula sp. JC737]
MIWKQKNRHKPSPILPRHPDLRSTENPLTVPANERFEDAPDGWPAWPPRIPELTHAISDSVARILQDGQWGTYPETTAKTLAEAARNQPGVHETGVHQQCTAKMMEAACEMVGTDRRGGTSNVAEATNARRRARLCSSGTSAIELALRALGVGSHKPSRQATDVILSAYDYPGNFRTIELLGGRPVLCDTESVSISRQSCSVTGVTPSLSSIESIQSPPGSVLLVSHLHGQLADSTALANLCSDRDWMLIEDACQAFGAGTIETDAAGKDVFHPVGERADWTTYSFGGSKPVTCGNGGALVTQSEKRFHQLRGIVDRPSDTFPMSPLQCAALLPQLPLVSRWNAIRCENALKLSQLDWESVGCMAIWDDNPAVIRAPYKFPVLARDAETRSRVLAAFKQIQLPCGEGFRSMHRTSDRRSSKPVPLDNAAILSDRLLVVDHRALLADDVADRVKACLRTIAGGSRIRSD